MSDFQIQKIGDGISNVGKSLKKKPLIIGVAGAVIVGAVLVFMKNRNSSSSSSSGTTQTVDPYSNIATYDGQTAGPSTGEQIAESQNQIFKAVSQAIETSQEETLSSVTDLIAKQKAEYDSQLEYTNSSMEKYGTATSEALQKITDSVRTNADITASKFNTLDQKISSIPIYNQAPAPSYSSAPVINYPTATPATPTATPAQTTAPAVTPSVAVTPTASQAPATAKETYAGIYQNGLYVGNNGQGYNEAVSKAFESSLKTDQSAYQKEIARVNEVIQNRTSLGLDTSLQYAYLNKIKQ